MNSKRWMLASYLLTYTFISGCASTQVAQNVQSGRFALQVRQPETAVGYFRRAAELDPQYVTHHLLRESVWTYLGRAYYETGNLTEARRSLDTALSANKDDNVARLYLGLVLLRTGDQAGARRETVAGLKGAYDWLEYVTQNKPDGQFWDPGSQIRSDIQTSLAMASNGKFGSPDFVASAEQVGRKLDEEIDRANRDEDREFMRGDN